MFSERVMFSFPIPMTELQQAVQAFAHQFGMHPFLYLQGDVLTDGQTHCLISNWHQIARFDIKLNLLGLGDPEEDWDEDLFWVTPTNSTYVLLSTSPLSSSQASDLHDYA